MCNVTRMSNVSDNDTSRSSIVSIRMKMIVMIMLFLASGRTVPLVSGEVKSIRITRNNEATMTMSPLLQNKRGMKLRKVVPEEMLLEANVNVRQWWCRRDSRHELR